jgi:predicted dehydrogenase
VENQAPLRVGIIGCGYQGSILARTIASSNVWRVPDAWRLADTWRISACADPNQAAAARVAAIAGGAAVYASTEDLLQGTDVDAVFVAVSHDALYECSLAAIQAGKHVMAEKPIGTDEKEAAQLEEAVARFSVCFMSGYSFRYIAAWQKVRELLQAGAVGEIQAITGAFGVGPLSADWKAHPDTGGGAMLYIGANLVDQILWYMADDEQAGQTIEVAAGIRYRTDTRADETTTFQIRFSGGATAQGMVTQTAHDSWYHNLDIYGRQGRISLRGIGFNYSIDVVSSSLPAYAQPTSIHLPQMQDLRIVMHQPQLAEFAQAIRKRRQPTITVSDGRRVLKVLDAFIKSDRTGQPVRIG